MTAETVGALFSHLAACLCGAISLAVILAVAWGSGDLRAEKLLGGLADAIDHLARAWRSRRTLAAVERHPAGCPRCERPREHAFVRCYHPWECPISRTACHYRVGPERDELCGYPEAGHLGVPEVSPFLGSATRGLLYALAGAAAVVGLWLLVWVFA